MCVRVCALIWRAPCSVAPASLTLKGIACCGSKRVWKQGSGGSTSDGPGSAGCFDVAPLLTVLPLTAAVAKPVWPAMAALLLSLLPTDPPLLLLLLLLIDTPLLLPVSKASKAGRPRARAKCSRGFLSPPASAVELLPLLLVGSGGWRAACVGHVELGGGGWRAVCVGHVELGYG